jgi:hypothetical protein
VFYSLGGCEYGVNDQPLNPHLYSILLFFYKAERRMVTQYDCKTVETIETDALYSK